MVMERSEDQIEMPVEAATARPSVTFLKSTVRKFSPSRFASHVIGRSRWT